MTTLAINDLHVDYQLDGDPQAPVLVLSNSLGTTRRMWAEQVAAFSKTHRVLTYDTRGHGGSSAPAGSYTLEQLGQDVLALVDALQAEWELNRTSYEFYVFMAQKPASGALDEQPTLPMELGKQAPKGQPRLYR